MSRCLLFSTVLWMPRLPAGSSVSDFPIIRNLLFPDSLSRRRQRGIFEIFVDLSNQLLIPSFFFFQGWIVERAREMKCNADDIVDSVCLAIVANLLMQGKTESIPAEPMTDDAFIPIEVKIYVRDQSAQCFDYYSFAKEKDALTKVVYLTIWGNAPSQYSMESADGNTSLKSNDCICISFADDIIMWLDILLKEETDVSMKDMILQYNLINTS